MKKMGLIKALALVAFIALAVFGVLSGPLGLAGFAFAGVTTTDLTGSQKGMPWNGRRIRKRITLIQAQQIASDIAAVINVKAGWLVTQVQTIVVTATAGSALTVDVGDVTDPNGFNAAVNLKSVAGTEEHGAPGTDAYLTAGGRYYSADDKINLTYNTVTGPSGDVVLDVIVHAIDCN